jgi:Peptidase family M28/PA domain
VLRWAVLGIVVIAVAVAAALARGGEDAPPPREAAPEAAQRGLEAHLRALQRIADEHGGTRAAGSPGDAATADYIEARLREAGYRVRRDRFRVPFFRETGEPRLVVGGDAVEARTFQFSPGGTAAGRVRAAGLGCAPGDFAELRDGEIAFVRRGTCFFRVKAQNAQRAGAAAVLVTDDGLVPGSLQRPGLDVPAVAVREGDVVPGRRAELRVRARSELAETANVIGEIGPEGSVVMAGAHLDSVPAGPGLNDNGSGIAALLHTAERVAGRERPLRFGFWGAEEIGLIGSRRYVDALSASERDAITAYVNLDMVGTPDARLEVYDGAPRIELALRRHLPRGTGDIDLGDQSDHAPFEAAGIPIGGIFTGLDDCYHEACDTLGNVDREVLAGSASAAEAALLELAD